MIYRYTTEFYADQASLPELPDGVRHTVEARTLDLDGVLREIEAFLQQQYTVTTTIEPRTKGTKEIPPGRTLGCSITLHSSTAGFRSKTGLVEITLQRPTDR